VKRISDNSIYALKKVNIMSLSLKEQENALNEVRILASIKCPFIISYKEAFIEDSSQSLWYFYFSIIMEFADNGDLYQKITMNKKNNTLFDEESIWKVFIQVKLKKVIIGLRALHKLNIMHRDLKVILSRVQMSFYIKILKQN